MVTISNGPGHLAGQQGNMFKNNIQYQTLNLKKGGCLFHQGANIERLFFLEKGRVKLVRNTIEGQPLIIHIAYLSGFTTLFPTFKNHTPKHIRLSDKQIRLQIIPIL